MLKTYVGFKFHLDFASFAIDGARDDGVVGILLTLDYTLYEVCNWQLTTLYLASSTYISNLQNLLSTFLDVGVHFLGTCQGFHTSYVFVTI
jgi:hypothetical protein